MHHSEQRLTVQKFDFDSVLKASTASETHRRNVVGNTHAYFERSDKVSLSLVAFAGVSATSPHIPRSLWSRHGCIRFIGSDRACRVSRLHGLHQSKFHRSIIHPRFLTVARELVAVIITTEISSVPLLVRISLFISGFPRDSMAICFTRASFDLSFRAF